ncbi:unnamed protein product [Rhizophagus irregularis]|nr:unnamed protein product [Rhizophagus irregularis]
MQHQYSIINISSIEWIRLQFWPTNPTSTRAMHYTDDKHKVLIGEGAATSTAGVPPVYIIRKVCNAIRRATAFFNAIQTHYISHIPPILCLYTDNGHTTFGRKSCRANHVRDDHDIDNFFKIILEIDKSLNAFETTAELLSKKKDFQITLLIMLIVMYVCKQVRLPQHIFENIVFLPDPIPSISNTDCYNTETSEKYRPNGSYGTTSYLNKYQSS